jgi:hypothetical protein
MQRFHADLAAFADANPWFSYHYVAARELYNLARAAESGWAGSVDAARNFELNAGQVCGGTPTHLQRAANLAANMSHGAES